MSTYESGHEYDIIFAGGGTAACVAAGRLAAADSDLSILLVERGINNLNDPTVTNPVLYLTALAPGAKNMIFYQAESEPALNNQPRMLSTGGILGGGSSVNAMMYTRASGVDFDSFNAEGWDSESLVKYAKKLENASFNTPQLDESVHGVSGPIQITMGTHAPQGPMHDLYAAAQSLNIPYKEDTEDFATGHGIGPNRQYIGQNGTRQDAAHRYIHPLIADGKHPNLHILPETTVTRVLFSPDKRATGIECSPTPLFHAPGSSPTVQTIKAKKLVIVSAGPLSTPLILERSGIGNPELLSTLNIPLVSALPGVGENYQDHHFLLPAYKTHLSPDETMDALVTGRRSIPQLLAERHPMLGWNGIDVVGKLRLSDAEASSLGPEFKSVWDKDFASEQSKPISLFGTIAMFMGDREALRESETGDQGTGQYITMAQFTPYPYSRGSIHIASSESDVPPKLITGFLGDKDGIDLKKAVWAYKKCRDLYRRTNAFAGEVLIQHPRFREGSKAACSEGPLVENGFSSVAERKRIPAVEYDEHDDGAIEEWVRDNVQSTWHSLGTCKIGKREEGGVVDEELNVYGTSGLKCCDLSVIPENVGANTNNTALIVGEKAADIIGKELGLIM